MIADAKKALDFQVRIDELESLGGRILTPDDEGVGDWGQQGKGLLSPSLDGVVGNPWEGGHREGARGEGDVSEVGQREGAKGDGDESEVGQREGSIKEGDESEVPESEELESMDTESPSLQDEAGPKGLGSYLGSLGESLGL